MSGIMGYFYNLVVFPGGLFALAVGMFFAGIDRKIYARMQRRVGPPIYQPIIDLIKLMHKETLIPRTSNQKAFRLAPLAGFAGMLVLVTCIPVPGVFQGIGQLDSLLLILYILAIPAIALMVGASSSGSPFGAVGVSREMVMTIAYEVPLIIVILTIGIKAGNASGVLADFSLKSIISIQKETGSILSDITMVPAFIAFLCCIPGTLGAVPFDIPEAETEIAEGPILEYSGISLGLFKLTGWLKMFAVSALATVLFYPVPYGSHWLLSVFLFILKCLFTILISVTLVRATMARMRIDQAYKFYLRIPTGLALLSLVLTIFHVHV